MRSKSVKQSYSIIITISSIVLIQILNGSFCFSNVNDTLPFYNMKTVIKPGSSEIFVHLEILNPNDSSFYLCRNFEILSIRADENDVPFTTSKSDFMSFSKVIGVKTKLPEKLVIEYSGKLVADSFPRITSVVNMISPGLAELAIYTIWYPRFRNFKVFNFRIDAELPAGWVTILNGRQTAEKMNNETVVTTWESFCPAGDILLFSAPGMKRAESKLGDLSVELFFDKIPSLYIDSMKANLLTSMVMMKKHISARMSNNMIKVAYSPRPGWGYVRTPFIVVDEESALAGQHNQYGQARNFKYITHEISHYWWSVASTSTPDDWINEGFSEYCSLWISQEVYGKDFTGKLIKEYIDRTENAKADVSIAETTHNSIHREVNRYDKPALIFYYTALRMGNEKMLSFMSLFYEKCLNSKNVNTTFFLKEIESYFGNGARDFFSQILYNKEWDLEKIKAGF